MVETAERPATLTQDLTVRELLDRWLDFITPQREPGTIRAYRRDGDRLKAQLGTIKADKLTAQHLDRAYAAWLAEGLSPTTVHHLHATMSAALRQAVRWQLLSRAVTELAAPPPMRRHAVPAVNPSEVRALIAASEATGRPVLAGLIALAAATFPDRIIISAK